MPESTDSVRVVAICGSLRAESYTRAGLLAALQGAQELGIDARLIDLNDYNLPLFDASKENSDQSDGVLRLRQDVQRAHGILPVSYTHLDVYKRQVCARVVDP